MTTGPGAIPAPIFFTEGKDSMDFKEYKAKCTVCKEEVKYPDFVCKKQHGNHQVEARSYFHLGGRSVTDMRDRKNFSPQVILVPAYTEIDKTGRPTLSRCVKAEFSYGKFVTSDPEEQYHLERRVQMGGDIVTDEKQWEAVYLTEKQQIDKERAELEALKAQMKDTNPLLEKVKAGA